MKSVIQNIKKLLLSKDSEDIRLKHFLYTGLFLWSLIVGSSFILVVFQNSQSIHTIIENIARANFEKDQAFRFWAASHGGVYVPTNDRTPPNPHLSHISDRDITKPDKTELTLMNPAYMVRQISNEYSGLYGAKSKITSLKYLNKLNKPDEWETKALKSFEKGSKEAYEYTEIDNEPYLRLMRPMYIKKSCLKCHAFQGYKIGDVRGGVGVSLPLKELYWVSNKNILIFVSLHFLIWLLGIVGIGIFTHREYKYLQANKKAQAETLKEKQSISTIINFIPDLLWMKDTQGTYLICNKRFEDFFGASQKEIIGKTDYDFVSKELADSFIEHDNNAMNSDVPLTNEEEIPFASDGHKEYVQTTKTSVRDENGNILGVLGVGRDITELKEKDEIMIAQSRHAAMGEMISMIAHQWRQPISAIAMDANNILADIGLDMLDSETLSATSKDIIHQTQELSKTIDDFKNFFRPGKTAEEVSIEDVFNEAFSVVGKSLENNNVTVKKEFKISNKITTYSRELMQVVINIIKNAKEALLENNTGAKEIGILVKEEPNKFTINICDNAGGIDKDIIDKIFDPYFTTKDEKQGTGLGLYMSKTIVEKHLKGKIEVSNIKDGACFKITLPKTL